MHSTVDWLTKACSSGLSGDPFRRVSTIVVGFRRWSAVEDRHLSQPFVSVVEMRLFRHPFKCFSSEFKCFSSDHVLKDTLGGGDDRRELPDGIIVDILSRLPAECVLELRRVCKRWLSLTSTPYFARIHLKRSKPVLFLRLLEWYGHDINRKLVLYQLEDEYNSMTKKKTMKTKKMRDDFIWLVGEYKMLLKASCDGFLVFQAMGCPSTRLVCNLVTRERLRIDDGPAVNDPSGRYSSVNAMFLHPVTKEYTMLVQNPSQGTWPNYSLFDFHLYSFTSKSWRQISSFHHIPEYATHPVLHNNRLHWMTSSGLTPNNRLPCDSMIILFDTITEEFRVMPHPGDSCSFGYHHKHMFFYEDVEEGTLCLCWAKQKNYPRLIEIWALEDYDKWRWTKKKCVAPEVLQKESLNPKVMFEQELVYQTHNTQQLYRTHLHDDKKNQELAIIFENPRRRRKEEIKGMMPESDLIIALPLTKSFVSLNAGIQHERAS